MRVWEERDVRIRCPYQQPTHQNKEQIIHHTTVHAYYSSLPPTLYLHLYTIQQTYTLSLYNKPIHFTYRTNLFTVPSPIHHTKKIYTLPIQQSYSLYLHLYTIQLHTPTTFPPLPWITHTFHPTKPPPFPTLPMIKREKGDKRLIHFLLWGVLWCIQNSYTPHFIVIFQAVQKFMCGEESVSCSRDYSVPEWIIPTNSAVVNILLFICVVWCTWHLYTPRFISIFHTILKFMSG